MVGIIGGEAYQFRLRGYDSPHDENGQDWQGGMALVVAHDGQVFSLLGLGECVNMGRDSGGKGCVMGEYEAVVCPSRKYHGFIHRELAS